MYIFFFEKKIMRIFLDLLFGDKKVFINFAEIFALSTSYS